jgi:hypothetical protein
MQRRPEKTVAAERKAAIRAHPPLTFSLETGPAKVGIFP